MDRLERYSVQQKLIRMCVQPLRNRWSSNQIPPIQAVYQQASIFDIYLQVYNCCPLGDLIATKYSYYGWLWLARSPRADTGPGTHRQPWQGPQFQHVQQYILRGTAPRLF